MPTGNELISNEFVSSAPEESPPPVPNSTHGTVPDIRRDVCAIVSERSPNVLRHSQRWLGSEGKPNNVGRAAATTHLRRGGSILQPAGDETRQPRQRSTCHGKPKHVRVFRSRGTYTDRSEKNIRYSKGQCYIVIRRDKESPVAENVCVR